MSWRFVLIRVVVNFVAVMLTVLVLPTFNVINPWLGSWLIDLAAAGLALAVLNTFLKPVLQVLAGRLTIATLGLAGFFIDALMLGVLILLSPNRWQVDSLLTLLLAGALIAVLSTILEAVLGVDKPIIEATESNSAYWRIISRLPIKRRSWFIENLRLQQTYTLIARYLADIVVSRTPLSDVRYAVQRWIHREKQRTDLSTPEKVRLLLQDLGPTYVKIGQMASSRPELLPPGYQTELARLQSTVRPFPYEQVVDVITRELKGAPAEVFKEFNPEPLAAASTAQVHRAVLPTGEEVVVKVQRPDIVPQVRADLGVMHEIAKTLRRRGVLGASIDAVGTIDEFGANVMRELDYQNEAYNARRMAHNMQAIPGIHVPVIYSAHTTSKVLTMELVRGVKLIRVDEIEAAGLDRAELARTFIRAIMKQVLVDGFFHGDPHPGNLLVNLETGVIQLLDLGMVGEIDLQQRISLGDLLFSMQGRDADGMASAMLSVSVPFRPDADAHAFKQAIERVVMRYMLYSDMNASVSELLSVVLKTLSETGFRLNPNMTLAIKVMAQVEEVMRTLHPDRSMIFTAIEEAQHVLRQEVTVEKISALAKKEATAFAREAVKRLPALQGASLKWLDNFQKGRFEIVIDTSDLGQHVDRFNVSTERLMVGLILAGMLVGGAIVLTVPANNEAGALLKLVVLLIFIFAAAIGLWLVLRILWRSFREERRLDDGRNPWK